MKRRTVIGLAAGTAMTVAAAGVCAGALAVGKSGGDAAMERRDPGTPAGQAADCERLAEIGRERLDARLHAARRQGSVEQLLCVAEALAALGDGPAAREAVRVAQKLTGSDTEARAEVRAFRERFAEWAGAPLGGDTAARTAVAAPLPESGHAARTPQTVALAVRACLIGGAAHPSAQPPTPRGDPS
jgi:hypothetical protein